MSQLTIKLLAKGADLRDAFAVREAVFQQGQGVDLAIDFDGLDEAADQFVGYTEGEAVATARVRYLPDGTAKIERVAVLEACRGKSYGAQLMTSIIEHLRQRHIKTAVLEAQTHAINFYRKLDFEPVGEVFEDAGIPHIKMVSNNHFGTS